MDPNELLRRIEEFIRARRTGDCVDEWCQELFQWIAKGGFEPEWSKYETGTSYYRCREISEKKRGHDETAAEHGACQCWECNHCEHGVSLLGMARCSECEQEWEKKKQECEKEFGGHDFEDQGHAGPESGCIDLECRRCGHAPGRVWLY